MKKSFFFVCVLLFCMAIAKSQEYIPDAVAVTNDALKERLWKFVDSVGSIPPGTEAFITLRPNITVQFGDGFKVLDADIDLLPEQKDLFLALIDEIKKPGNWKDISLPAMFTSWTNDLYPVRYRSSGDEETRGKQLFAPPMNRISIMSGHWLQHTNLIRTGSLFTLIKDKGIFGLYGMIGLPHDVPFGSKMFGVTASVISEAKIGFQYNPGVGGKSLMWQDVYSNSKYIMSGDVPLFIPIINKFFQNIRVGAVYSFEDKYDVYDSSVFILSTNGKIKPTVKIRHPFSLFGGDAEFFYEISGYNTKNQALYHIGFKAEGSKYWYGGRQSWFEFSYRGIQPAILGNVLIEVPEVVSGLAIGAGMKYYPKTGKCFFFPNLAIVLK